MKTRVVVAMSGGVDSSVAASLLVDQGYDVIGVTMQIWHGSQVRTGEKARGCCGIDASLDAFSVANLLGIPHYVLNFQEVFRKHVVENFTKEYLSGRTPNPCVRCNEFVKFDALLEKARFLEANYLATGHYANAIYSQERNRHLLLKGKDRKKDQSYVLYPLNQEELKMCIFPLGNLTKEETRAYAKKRGLTTAEKGESYDICFVPDGNYAQFVENETGGKSFSGRILNENGEELGEHKGLLHYTVGQRRRLGISSKDPLYVLSIQPETNTLVVGGEKNLFSSSLLADHVNWVSIPKPRDTITAAVKIRYRASEVPASLTMLENGRVKVDFFEPQKAVAPGQSVVFYERDLVLGGGIIF